MSASATQGGHNNIQQNVTTTYNDNFCIIPDRLHLHLHRSFITIVNVSTGAAGLATSTSHFKCDQSIHCVEVLHPTRHKIVQFGDVLPSQSLDSTEETINQAQQKQTTKK